ncbi:MAG: hypothetical protein DRP29_08100 [Thermodesulfobacteriota bacterium]|nr:MAG: hypothetical protein DRP29_08100 [Thermodesulfobacteriota bacterium]
MANLSVGQELLNVPFPEMVQKLALAIAEGQVALDLHSIEVAKALAETTLPQRSVPVFIKETVDSEGKIKNVEVEYNEEPMPLIVYGIQPTFYQFTDTVIEVKMIITMALEREFERKFETKFNFKNETTVEGGYSGGGLLGWLFGRPKIKVKNTTTVALATTYNARYSQKYTFKEEGTSLLRTVLKPVPPPERAIPTVRVEEESSGGGGNE